MIIKRSVIYRYMQKWLVASSSHYYITFSTENKLNWNACAPVINTEEND